MSRRIRHLAIVLGLLVTALAATGADDTDDPLPKGAKVRFGSARMARSAFGITLLPPDYKTVVTADIATGLRHFDLATGRPLDKAVRAAATGGGVVISADGKRAVGNHTGIQTVRDTATGAALQQLHPPAGFSTTATSGPPAVSLSADGSFLAQAGQAPGPEGKGEVLVWDVGKSEVIARLTMPHRGVAIPILSPDGKVLATWSYQYTPTGPGPAVDPRRTISVWDIATKKKLFQAKLTGGGYQALAVAFSPDGSTLAAANGDGPIDLWDAKTGKPLGTLLGRTGQGMRLAYSPDGKTLAAAAFGGTIQRWAADGKLLDTTEGPSHLPIASPLGLGYAGNDRVVAWSAIGSVTVAWEAPSGKLLTVLAEHTAGIKGIGFATGGKELITAGLDGNVVRWDMATGKTKGAVEVRVARSLATPSPLRPMLNLSPDGTRGVSLGITAAVYDLASGSELFAIPRGPATYPMTHQIPSADLTKLVTLSLAFDMKLPGRCAVWNLVEQRKEIEFDLPGVVSGITPTAAVSPAGTRLVTVTSTRDAPTGRLMVMVTGWDLKTGRKLGEVEDINASGTLHVAAASETSAVLSSGNRLWAVDYEGGRAGDEIEGLRALSQGAAGPIAFSPDGKRFATGVFIEPGKFGVRVYDWPRATPLHTFAGHAGPVTALAFSQDGQHIGTGSADTTVLLWDMSAVRGN